MEIPYNSQGILESFAGDIAQGKGLQQILWQELKGIYDRAIHRLYSGSFLLAGEFGGAEHASSLLIAQEKMSYLEPPPGNWLSVYANSK
jgi:hypothetical protein